MRLCRTLMVYAALGGLAMAGEWPNWRGPGGMGVAVESKLPDPWPAGEPKLLWQAALRGGWSSPVVADNRVFITDREGNTERVLAFDAATGRELWKQTNPVEFDPHPVGRGHGNGPKATPVVHDGKVYTVGIAGWLQCLEAATGRVLWKVNYPAEFAAHVPLPGGRAWVNGTDNVIVPVGNGEGAPVPLFGYTGSPAIAGELLIAPVGGQRAGTIVAFSKDTGRVVWKSLSVNVSYSSPVVASPGGVPQVVVMTGPSVVGLDLADGHLLWDFPFQIQYDESICTPVVAGDQVLFTATGQPLTCLRIARRANQLAALVAWTNEDSSSYLSSQVVHEGYTFGMDEGGQFHCLRLADGAAMWAGGNHGYYCTPVVAGARLLALNERGELAVLAATPQRYQLLGGGRLARAATWTSPAVVGNRIYIRSGNGLAAFEF